MTNPPPTENTPAPFQRSALLAFSLAILLGLWANILFYKQSLGISVFAFCLAGLVSLFAVSGHAAVKPRWRSAWLAAPLLFFAALVAVRDASFSVFLNLAAAGLLILLLAHLFNQGNIFHLGFGDYIWRPIVSTIEIGFIRPPSALRMSWRAGQGQTGISPRLAAVLRGLLLAIPVVALFTALLTSADVAFNKLVLDIFKWFKLDNLPELVARLLFAGTAAWLCLGGIAYALRREIDPAAQAKAQDTTAGRLGFTEAAVVLGSVNALFAAFIAVQVRYFFGGQSNINIEGFTYAEYTRRGFAELVFVAIFTLGLGLLLQALTRRATRSAKTGFEVLVVILAAFTGVILVSAFRRLLMYEEAYGFTQLRTFVHVFMLMIGGLLVVFVLSVHTNRPRLFALGLFLSCLGFVAALNILNTDAFIVRQNMQRYASSGKLDAVYLATLSQDATPELLKALDDAPESERQILASSLHYRLNQLETNAKAAKWPAWNYSRWQAMKLLRTNKEKFADAEPRQYHWDFPMD